MNPPSGSLRGASIAIAIALTGCGGGGALGQSHTAADTDKKGVDAPLAVGATMRPDVTLELRGSGGPALAFESVAPSILKTSGADVTGVSPGVSALLIKTKDDQVLDWVHLWVEKPTHLELHVVDAEGGDRGPLRGGIDLVVGESLRVKPIPFAHEQALVGSGPTSWEIAPAVAEVLREGTLNRQRLFATRPGKARVTVHSLGLEQTFDLVVLPQAEALPNNPSPQVAK